MRARSTSVSRVASAQAARSPRTCRSRAPRAVSACARPARSPCRTHSSSVGHTPRLCRARSAGVPGTPWTSRPPCRSSRRGSTARRTPAPRARRVRVTRAAIVRRSGGRGHTEEVPEAPECAWKFGETCQARRGTEGEGVLFPARRVRVLLRQRSPEPCSFTDPVRSSLCSFTNPVSSSLCRGCGRENRSVCGGIGGGGGGRGARPPREPTRRW
jgi:hypothetical protein